MPIRLMEQKWDYLIILDACRYDYFERLWQQYLSGTLRKKTSPATSTPEWLSKSFPGYYDDIIYISANPYINSLAPVRDFSAKAHFHKIYDLWRDNWDSEKDTVLPGTVTARAREIINANSGKRAIIHYLQPHEPYLSDDFADLTWHRPEPIGQRVLKKAEQGKQKTKLADKAQRIIAQILYRIGLRGKLSLWRLRKLLKMPPMSHMDAVRRAYGTQGLRKAYGQNLQIVLRHVAELIESLSGTVVVTADHGEMLGEGGAYSHWDGSDNKPLREVPWLVIDKGPKSVEHPEHAEKPEKQPAKSVDEKTDKEAQEEIKEKLRALGYFG